MHGFTAVFDLDTPDEPNIHTAIGEAFAAADRVGDLVLTSLEVGRSPDNKQWMLFAAFNKASD